MKKPSIAIVAALLVAASVAGANAADFSISPTTITLTNEPAADVVVTNTGTAIVRITVRAFAWSQDAGNVEKLTESDKIVYYPEIFAIPPGGTQRIRVGVSGSPAEREQAYRLVITELPPAAGVGGPSTGVTFVGRVDMPVFVPPGNGIPQTRQPKFVSLAAERGAVTAVLTNEGTVHVRQSTLEFTGIDRHGAAVWHETKQPFYILPGATQTVRAVVPPSICSTLHSITAQWSLRDNAGVLTSSANVVSCK